MAGYCMLTRRSERLKRFGVLFFVLIAAGVVTLSAQAKRTFTNPRPEPYFKALFPNAVWPGELPGASPVGVAGIVGANVTLPPASSATQRSLTGLHTALKQFPFCFGFGNVFWHNRIAGH